MKTMQKTAETCSNEQLEKLNSVKPKEWMDVQKALLPTIARRLHGRVKTDKDGHVELEAFVQATGESLTMKKVNERLGLKGDDRDRLQKRLKRRVGKKLPCG